VSTFTRAAARGSTLVLIAATFAAVGPSSGGAGHGEELEGRAPTQEELEPSVQAAFAQDSYAPGDVARLVFFSAATHVRAQVFHTGPESQPTVGYDQLQGVPVSTTWSLPRTTAGNGFDIRVGAWSSGLYFARLTDGRGRVGFAPFVVRPRHLGEHAVAVVEPTLTWQAYNLRDDDGDGKGDSWYANWSHTTVRLHRPFLSRGVPYNFRRYDLPFLHWLSRGSHGVDMLTDSDLDRVSGRALARAYRLIVFPGHHEYVTTHEYDAITRYRDLGGHLAFLSANDFFWRVVRHGNLIEKSGQWRDLGRPEAALIGVQYRGNDRGTHRGPWVLRDTEAAPWLFAGTGLADGMPLGSAGIEIDSTTPASPKSVHILADIRDLFGRGFTAQMAYYRTPRGAEVFAAGAFTLAGSALEPDVSRLLDNLWRHLATPGDAQAALSETTAPTEAPR
jgi:hypothetical protein